MRDQKSQDVPSIRLLVLTTSRGCVANNSSSSIATPATTPDPWHFARPELAQKYLQTFEIGLISAQALFAPRRMGKSEFLEQD